MDQPVILVVDDQAPLRKFTSINLKAGGCAILTAADGPEAFTLIAEHPRDLLLLGVNLPD